MREAISRAKLIRGNPQQKTSIKYGAHSVTKWEDSELEGITLAVYWYVVKQAKPVGPRDTMKGAHLSSPSVAYRHLQKLEDMGLLQKNEYGEYIVKQKVNVAGYLWVGRQFLSKMHLYALIFASFLVLELIIFGIHYHVEDYKFKIFFLLLISITGATVGLFSLEGYLHRKRLLGLIQNTKQP
jgi:hypothetical protein